MNSFNELPLEFDFLELGQTYHVISDVTRLTRGALRNHEKFDPDAFITSLQNKVTDKGTLLFPTFCYGFCKGETFDVNNTPGVVGVLGNVARQREDFIRTSHATHSFAVWGAKKGFFDGKDYKDAFGAGSIFADLVAMKAKVLVIDLENTMSGMTLMHHAEQMVGVPYRYNKVFTAPYIDRDGREQVRSYNMYVRDLKADPRDHSEQLCPIIRELGIAKDYFVRDIRFTVVDMAQLYEVICMDILNNDSAHLYDYNH